MPVDDRYRSLAYERRAHRKPTVAMTTHQAGANHPFRPMPVPSSSPRSVSMIGVNGWYSANQRTAVGIVAVGTKPLPRNGSRMSGIGMLLADSTVLAARPQPTPNQVIASAASSISPAAESH